jgi:Pyruvate/2-oxoacid:ferredoxin oxidoreductase gamma subunit
VSSAARNTENLYTSQIKQSAAPQGGDSFTYNMVMIAANCALLCLGDTLSASLGM